MAIGISDMAKHAEAVYRHGLLEEAEDKDFTQLTTSQREIALSFAAVSKKSAITAKERDVWTDYFHNRALKKFNQNCLKQLLTEHDLDTEI